MSPHLPRAGHCDSRWMGSLLALDLWSAEKRWGFSERGGELEGDRGSVKEESGRNSLIWSS